MTTNGRVRQLLERLVDEVPAQMTAAGYERASCILSTRVAVDALRELGVRARPLAARVLVGNAAWIADTTRLGRPPEPAEWSPGTWCVGIGYGLDPRATRPGFDGHVIAIVNDRWALDLTIDQADRPAHGIALEPHYWSATAEFLAGERIVSIGFEDCVACYAAMPDERSYLRSPDWARRPGRLVPTAQVIAALR